MHLREFQTRANQLVQQFDTVIATKFTTRTNQTFVEPGAFRGARSAALSFLKATFGCDHPYYTEFDKLDSTGFAHAAGCKQILVAARDEIAGGWTASVRGLITAEVFSDFLDMARHFLDENYKDAAAVMIGSVLEEHLRQLCIRQGLPIEFTSVKGDGAPKKADVLNADLVKAGVYNKLDQKQVTALLDLRNKAAHGHYDEYTHQQVELMYQQAVDFMARNTAT